MSQTKLSLRSTSLASLALLTLLVACSTGNQEPVEQVIGDGDDGTAAGSGTAAGGASNVAIAAGGTALSGDGVGGTPANLSGTGGVSSTEGSGGSVSNGGSDTNAPTVAEGCPRGCGPTFDQFFDGSKLATINIEIDDVDLNGVARESWLDVLWDKWSHCAPFDWVRTTVSYESPDGVGNEVMENVGMRLRGSNGRGTNPVQGFKLDMQALDTPGEGGSRRFANLNRINFLSVERDDTHMIPCLAYNLMGDYGLPAPRCNHIKVYVNGAYYGVMENIEQVNRGFVRRHFGSNEGSLYAGSPSQGRCEANPFEDSKATLHYVDDSFASYADQYMLDSATAEAAEADLIPMLKCGDPTQTPDDAAFRTCISEWLDVDEWLKQIAAESVIPTVEAFVGYYRNFYLYFNPDPAAPHGGRFSVWSWDLDASFSQQSCTPSNCDLLTGVSAFYGPRNERALLVQRLLDVFRAEYCTALTNFTNNVYDPARLDAMAATMKPGLTGEPNVTEADWQSKVDSLRSFITERKTEAQTLITELCQ